MDPIVQTFVIASIGVIVALFAITCTVNKISEEREEERDLPVKPKKYKKAI